MHPDLIFSLVFWVFSSLGARGVAKGGQWGTYVPGRRDTGALKWNLQKFHNKGKKAVTSKIAPVADIV